MHWFLRPDSLDYDDMVADSAITALAAEGVDGFTVRRIAHRLGMTGSALVQHYARRGGPGGREQLIVAVAARFTDRWLAWSVDALFDAEPTLAMPGSDEDVMGVGAWFSFEELARAEGLAGRPAASEIIGEARTREVESVGRMIVDEHEAAEAAEAAAAAAVRLVLLAEALRRELTRPVPLIDAAAARALQRATLDDTLRRVPRAG